MNHLTTSTHATTATRRVGRVRRSAAPWLGSPGVTVVLVFLGIGCLSVALADVCGLFDESVPTGPIFGDLPENLPPANEGAFEGGPTGTHTDQGINNAVPEDQQSSGHTFDIPTGGVPSPLFGSLPFTQQMLRFEEFGTEPMPTSYIDGGDYCPTPLDAQSGPDEAALDAFLAQEMYPEPTRLANCEYENPWKAEIEAFLGRTLDTPPAEGRPPGEGWAHQRWDEFPPEVYYKTAQAGARVNLGLRDSRQRHGYNSGEFAPGGLYYNTVGVPGFEGTTAGIPVAFHPNMPIQEPEAIWTFDGTFPPKLLTARYGETVLMRHYNALPIDPSANLGFGIHTITSHEHNGHTPAESDGYTNAFFFPGQFYDYRWPLELAGRDSVNTDASDPKAATPCSSGESLLVDGVMQMCNNGTIQLPGDWRETMSTHWFHDHMLDFTAQNVYKGNAVMMNYYSALDRGNEAVVDGVNLRLPSGTALDWGNRDYDVQLLLADKGWDQTGQLWFNIFNLDGFLGDQLLTNWLYHPYFEVRARRYRFRILNASVSRYFKVALVKEVNGAAGAMAGPPGSGVSYDRVAFHLVANDGNIMEHAVAFDGTLGTEMGVLPTQGIAERYDIVVDFAGFMEGDKLYLVNTLEHKTGRRPEEAIPLADVLSEAYKGVTQDDDGDGAVDRWVGGDPCVGKFLELRMKAYTGTDLSMEPADYVVGGATMIPLAMPTDNELANALHRTFSFGRSSGTDGAPWTIKTDGGSGFTMDPRRLSAAPNLELGDEGLGHLEIWHIKNGGGGWSHPIHIHFEEGIILRRGGEPPPEWEKWARKDLYRIGRMSDSTDSVEIAIRFREFAGTYMEHCHNTQHEDHAMLMRWDIEHPGQYQLMPTPMPTWDGVEYVDTVALPTVRTGDGIGPSWDDVDGDCALNGCSDSCTYCDAESGECQWCIFDHNSSGATDGLDFALFAGCFGSCYAADDPCAVTNYDGSADNCVGGSDFGGLSSCFGLTCAECGLCDGGNSDPGPLASAESQVDPTAAIHLVAVRAPAASDFADRLPKATVSFGEGETLYLELWAARTGIVDGTEDGFAAVYTDVAFDPELLDLRETIPSELFGVLAHAQADTSGSIYSLGGCAPLGTASVGVDSAWVRVSTARFHVTGVGRAHVTVGPSQGPYGVSIFGRFGDLGLPQIDFHGTRILLGKTTVLAGDEGPRIHGPSRK